MAISVELENNTISAELDKHIEVIGRMLHGKEGQALWNIFAALRGPDNEDLSLKSCTTCVFRFALLKQAGLNPQRGDFFGSSVLEDNEEFRARRQMYDEMVNAQTVHFLQHTRLAFDALGLNWSQVNP